MSVIVIEFITLDGIVSDPDGRAGTPGGGWAFRYGPEEIAGDKFRLGSLMDDGVLLFGRQTWEQFSKLWPGRDTPFAQRMNAAAKLVCTRTLTDVSAWANSEVLHEDPAVHVKQEDRDVVVVGSVSLVHALMAQDVIDEYRLMTFPTVIGTGQRLFPEGISPTNLDCVSAEQVGAAVFSRYTRSRESA